MRAFIITTQMTLLLLITSALIGCSQQNSPPTHSHAATQEQQEAHPTMGYDWEITTLESVQPGRNITLNFELNEQGSRTPLGELNILHEKKAHLIIVNKDLNYFAHLHPEVSKQGKMRIETQFPKAGEYVMFLQFAPAGQAEQTLRQVFQVGTQHSSSAQLKPDVDSPKTVNGYTYQLTSVPTKVGQATMVALNIEKAGNPLTTIQPYLGAGGHAVLLSEDTKSFLHVHPVSQLIGNYYQSPLKFHTEIAKPGLYKMWIQVQVAGKVETIDFTFQVH